MERGFGESSKSDHSVAIIRMLIEQIARDKNSELLANPSTKGPIVTRNRLTLDLIDIHYLPDESILFIALTKESYGSMTLISVKLRYEGMSRVLDVEYDFPST